MKDVKVSVIIPTFNRYNSLKKCLESLAKQTFNEYSFEIIIVDDGDTENLEALIDNLVLQFLVKYFKQDHKGPAAARNLGIKMSQAEIVGFTDDDVIVDKDWIKNALKLFEDKDIAGVEGKVIIDRTKITPFSHNIENLTGGLFTTCNMFYRKSVLEEVSGFNERFSFAYREDADLVFRVMERGYKIVFSSDVIVFHNTNSHILEPFRQAKKYYIDPLLYKKHPEFYYSKIDVYDFKGFKLVHPRRRFYLIYIILNLLNLIAYFFFKDYVPILLFLLFFVYMIILFGHLRLWKNRRINIKDILLAMPIVSITPFIYYYYLIKGMIRFKSIILW